MCVYVEDWINTISFQYKRFIGSMPIELFVMNGKLQLEPQRYHPRVSQQMDSDRDLRHVTITLPYLTLWGLDERARDRDKDVCWCTNTHRHRDLQPSSFLLCTVGMLLLWRPSIHFFFVPSLMDSLQPCNSHWCQNKHTDKQPKANTASPPTPVHMIGGDMSDPPLYFYPLPTNPHTAVPHIATNISHELSATSPSWIFIKQNSKQIDFTPAALLHFYLILSLTQMLTCSSLPLPQFHCSILSPLHSFLMLCSTSFLCFLPVFSLLSFFFTLSSPLSHPASSAFHSLHFLKPHFPASPDLCSWICGPEESCCWWADELCFEFCVRVCMSVYSCRHVWICWNALGFMCHLGCLLSRIELCSQCD